MGMITYDDEIQKASEEAYNEAIDNGKFGDRIMVEHVFYKGALWHRDVIQKREPRPFSFYIYGLIVGGIIGYFLRNLSP